MTLSGNMSEQKLEVAIFNGERKLIAVREVPACDHVTDPKRRQMKLPSNHDVHTLIGRYKITPEYDMLEPILEDVVIDPNFILHSVALTAWKAVQDRIFRIYKDLMRDKHPMMLL